MLSARLGHWEATLIVPNAFEIERPGPLVDDPIYLHSLIRLSAAFVLFFFLCFVSEFGDFSRGWPEGSLFNSYYTKV